MANVSFTYNIYRKSLRLLNPVTLLSSEKPLLVFYRSEHNANSVYLYIKCSAGEDYIYIEVSTKSFREYLRNKIALHEVLYNCQDSSIYYASALHELVVELPFIMLDHYRISFAELKIKELPDSINIADVSKIYNDFNPPGQTGMEDEWEEEEEEEEEEERLVKEWEEPDEPSEKDELKESEAWKDLEVWEDWDKPTETQVHEVLITANLFFWDALRHYRI